MAQYAFSLNGLIDGTTKTVIFRFNIADDQLPPFFDFYRSRAIRPPVQPPPPPATDEETFHQWAKQVMNRTQGEIRADAEVKKANEAVAGMPPVQPPTEV